MTTIITALTALRDAGLVTDRDTLNRGWSELTGRSTPTPPTPGEVQCQHPTCSSPGRPYTEPAGVWCNDHRPILWRCTGGSPWATPRCHRCGRPGSWPNRGNQITRPTCRDHAPRWMTQYLAHDPEPEDITR